MAVHVLIVDPNHGRKSTTLNKADLNGPMVMVRSSMEFGFGTSLEPLDFYLGPESYKSLNRHQRGSIRCIGHDRDG